ncbi:unnamed protein product [Symbiodinium necroappetens]|uniref:Uncharacterized protein n=1 Tax=Symbiodinium necroappetens TaxID=1628268 RepID=A0A812JDS0_9DINO|nr:unnamed protein product [Symbiodinium necroappetens]
MALESERQELGDLAVKAESAPPDPGQVDAPALASLAEEIEVRLGALREDATVLLDGIMSEDANSEAAPDLASLATTRDLRSESSVDSAEEAIEVATTLGVDTGAAEERLASVRRMLSVRVVWDTAVRFFLLPLRVSFKALVQQVAVRFRLPKKAPPLQLCWREAEECYPLDGEAAWEECLARRGLAERPGRLELQVLNRSKPPQRRRKAEGPSKGAGVDGVGVAGRPSPLDVSRTGPTDAMFLITGTQALPGPTPTMSADFCISPDLRYSPSNDAPRGRTYLTRRKKPSGRAWAMSTGREQPVSWLVVGLRHASHSYNLQSGPERCRPG